MTTIDIGASPQRHARLLKHVGWTAATAVAAPLAIVCHELGHYATGAILGFEALQLHYGSVSHEGASSTSVGWEAAAFSTAGPAVTLGIVLACVLLVWRRPALAPFALGAAVGAGIRSVLLGLAFLMVQLQHPGAVGNFDEFNAAAGMGVPEWPVILANALAIVSAWVFCIRRMLPGQRISGLISSALGTAVGISLYMAVLGPALLP